MNDIDDNTDGPVTAAPGTVALLNRSALEVQGEVARKHPRSIRQFRHDVLDMVTLSETIAEECVYSLPRDGKVIQGPSARFAEVALSAWGNCRGGARVVSDEGDFVTAQGVFYDLQRNVDITFEVQRRITNKNGRRFSADMIGVTSSAACSIALRNAILKGIPKAYWNDMYEAARKCALGDVKTLPNRRAEAFKACIAYGINKATVLAKLGLAGEEDMGRDELLIVRTILNQIRDGELAPERAFAPDPTDEERAGVQMPTRKSAGQGSGTPPPAPAPDTTTDAAPDEPAKTPAPAPAPKSKAAAPKPAPAPAADGEPTGEVASPALVNFLRNKVESLDLSESTVEALLQQFGGVSTFEQLSPAAALAIKNELAAQGA